MRTRKSFGRCTTVDALSLAQSIWEALDTPRSLALHIAAKYRDHKAILDLKDVDPSTYDCPERFFKDYQSSKILAKSVELNTGIDKEAVAYEKFLIAEKACRETNDFFRMRADGLLTMRPHVERVFQRARDHISSILGRVPSYDRLDFAFGPGACFGVRGDTSVYKKVTSNLECTYAMADVLPEFLAEFPGWITDDQVDVQLVRGSQLTFVPKDAATDRAICIEPLLNGLMQKGIGTYIRGRLKRHGVDLNDQSINQRLAQKAFSCGLSTIDLSSASDTIAYGLVMEMLPIDWFDFLDTSRCPNYLYRGNWKPFQKFSSMGNAYTFELETLIFYALAVASAEELGISYYTQGNLHVYGDDIIVPRAAYDLLTEVLSACGFTTNQQKSYKDGLFYESCGADYFRGFPVRPVFFKEKIGNRPLRVFYAINSIRRIQARLEFLIHAHRGPQRDHHRYDVLRCLDDLHGRMVDRLPQAFRVYGPEGHGDGHLISEFDEARPSKSAEHPSWEGWSYRSFRERPIRVPLESVPSGYALYFSRQIYFAERGQDPRTDDDWFYILSASGLRESDLGSGYDLRGRSRLCVGQAFCASSWRGWRTIYHSDGTTQSVHQDVPARLAA